MEDHFPASVLVVAGLLRVAGASRNGPWSSHTTVQSSQGLVTATGPLVPISEDKAIQLTLPFEGFTSDFPNDGVSLRHGIIRMEAEENSKDGGRPPLIFTDRQPRRAELSFSEGALLGHQSNDASTSRPQTSRSMSRGLSEMVSESASQPEALTAFLPREDGMENTTGQDLSVSGKQSAPVPTEMAAMDLLTALPPEPLESTGQKVTVDSSPSLTTRSGNSHTYPLGPNTTTSEVVLDETELTPAKERRGNLLTLLPSDSQQLLVSEGQTQPHLQTSELPGAPGVLVEARLYPLPLLQQRPLSEERVPTRQQPDFASSALGKATRHKVVGLQTAESPAVQSPSQSHLRSSSFLLTPETLSSGPSPGSAAPGDAGQRDQLRSVFLSLIPASSPSGGPDGVEEKQLQEATPLAGQQETPPQRATQPIIAASRDPLSVSKEQGTNPGVSVLTQEQPLLSTVLAPVYGQAQERVLSVSPPGETTSPHTHPTMPGVAAASHIQLPLPGTSDAAGHATQVISWIPLASMFLPLVHKQPASLRTSAPPLTQAELLASSTASFPTEPLLTPDLPGPPRLGLRASLPTVPQRGSEGWSVPTAASIPTKLPTLSHLASIHAGPPSPAATNSAHLTPRLMRLSTVAHGKPQGKAPGVSFQAEHPVLGSSVATPHQPTVPEMTASSPVETGTSAAGLYALVTAVQDGTEPNLSPDFSSLAHAITQPLPTRSHARLESAMASMLASQSQVSVLGVPLPTHFQSPKPVTPVFLTKEPQRLATPAHAHVWLDKKEAQAEGSLPVSPEARTSMPTHARTPLVLSFHPQTQHPMAHVAAQLGIENITRGAQTPNTPASSLLRKHPSSTPLFIQTELQPQVALTSRVATTPNPKEAIIAHPYPYLPSTLVLPEMHHPTAQEEEGKSSPQTSPPVSQLGIYSTTLLGISAMGPSQKTAEGREQSFGTPHSSTAISQIVHHKNLNLSVLSSVRLAEHFPGMRTTPVLAGDESENLIQSSQGFLLHLLNQSDVTVNGNVDSAISNSYLGIPSSLPYLSFLIRGAENMICLQPRQNAVPPSGGPNVSGPGVASFQEMLISPTFLGLLPQGTSSLMQASPSSVLLVKPMFVFLPTEGLEAPLLHSAEEEEEEEPNERRPFSNAAVLRLVASGYEPLAESNPTNRRSTRAGGPSTKRQASSGSAHSSVPEDSTGPVRRTVLKAELFPDLLGDVAPTRTKSLESRHQNEGSLSSILDPPKSEENHMAALSVEHLVSATPPMMASVRQSPQTLPSTSELLSSPLRITSLHTAMEHSASLMLARPLRSEHKSLLNTTPMLPAEEDPHPGSITLLTSSSKSFEEPLSTSSGRNMSLPLEVVKNLTSLKAVSHRFLITKEVQKHPSEIQHVPSTVSDFLTFSTARDLKAPAAAIVSDSESVPGPSKASKTSPHATNGTLANGSKFPLFSSIPLQASEKPRTAPSPTPDLASTLAHTSWSEKHLEDMNLLVRFRSPVSVSSQVSTNSYFATLATKSHRATRMFIGRASLTSPEGQMGAIVNNETGKRVSDTETHSPREANLFAPAMLGTAQTLLLSTGSASVAPGGSVGLQTEIHKSPVITLQSLSPSSTRQDTTPSPTSGRGPPSEAPHAEPHSLRLISVTAATNKAVFVSPSTPEEEFIRQGREQKAEVSPPFPGLSSLEGDRQGRARLLKYGEAQDSGSSMPSPGSTTSSLSFSVVTEGPAVSVTPLYSGVPSGGPVEKVLLNQKAHLQSLPLEASEATPSLHTQVLLSPESLSDTSEITAKGDFMVEATSAGEVDESYLHTVGEQATVRMDATEAASNDSQAVLQQSNSNSGLLDLKMDHRRRPTRSDDAFLDGIALVSDDACGSGNYTSEMSLRRSTGPPLSPPDRFLALIALQSNTNHPILKVESCCVTPTARPTGPDTACCLFPSIPADCRYIQLHQNSKPQTTSFTIQLFQMLNHSVAYLHCELSICLSNLPGCEQNCSENRRSLFKPGGRSSYQTFHNLISFGPVRKAPPESPSELTAESELAMVFPILLGSLAGIAVLAGLSIFIQFHQRNKVKMAADAEGDGLCTTP